MKHGSVAQLPQVPHFINLANFLKTEKWTKPGYLKVIIFLWMDRLGIESEIILWMTSFSSCQSIK